jgi:pimeloyl-ACP methyl ester carboxylesterase
LNIPGEPGLVIEHHACSAAGGGKVKPVSIEFVSAGSCVRGQFFPAAGTTPKNTLVQLPGWPGEPYDGFLDLCAMLAEQGINVCLFNPRGILPSEGTHSHANTFEDIESALQWLRQQDVQKRFNVDLARLALGGHSYGGGMAMAYAARDPCVQRVISIAGTDQGEFAREMYRNPKFAQKNRSWILTTIAPQGPVQSDYDAALKELIDHQEIYGLKENAAQLARRSIMLLGGWEDEQVTVEKYLFPLHRALRDAGARRLTLIVYHTDHNFHNVRPRLAADIARWLLHDGNL